MSKIRHYRELAEMSQVDLANEAGIGTSGAVSNYEAGRRTPDIHTLQAIHRVLSAQLRSKKIRLQLEDLIDEPQADQPESKPAA